MAVIRNMADARFTRVQFSDPTNGFVVGSRPCPPGTPEVSYESALRKGVEVRSRMVLRLQGGKLVGTNQARYHLKAGDSVAQRPTEGTRAP